MASWGRAVALGFVVWLVPFGVAFAAFGLKASWRSLFESIMPVTLAAVVVGCSLYYLRVVEANRLREGLLLGLLWLAISVGIDLPLMLSPPISMPPVEYLADIGLTYLMIPILTTGIALAPPGPEPGRVEA